MEAFANSGTMAPGVNLGSATSVLEFLLSEEFRVKTPIVR